MAEPNQNYSYRGPAPLEPASIGASAGQYPVMRQLQPSFAPPLHQQQQQQQPGAPPAAPQPGVVPTSSAATQQAGNTTRRTRITRACDTCRRKKIKCDVNSTFPCTTCQQYDWDCTFNDTAKKRGPPKGYIESLETRLKKMEKLLEQMQTEKGPQQQQQQQQQPEHSQGQKRKRSINDDDVESPSGSEDRSSAGGDYLDPEKQVMRYHGSSSGYYLMRNMFKEEQAGSSSSAGNEDEHRYQIALNKGKTVLQIREMNQDNNDLIVVRHATDVENQMASKDASREDLVPPQVMRALIDCYFEIPNVTLPVINKEQFLDAYEGRTSPPPPALLVYAIGTNACFLISSDNPVFKQAGVSRDYVYHKLVERASELVRREYLIPRISSIQALVILCSQPTYSTSSYRNWILAGMAVRMAQDLGLHRSLTSDDGSKELTEAKKRLWYSVYVTDRWCCAVMGRPLAIADSDCDIDLPDLPDNCIFVNFIKLSGILGEILRRVYSPKAKASGYKPAVMEPTVSSLQKMLQDWFAQLPDECRMTAEDLETIQREPERYAGSKKVTQGGPLTVCYYTVTLLLHRPFIVAEDEKTDLYVAAVQKCMSAAKMAVDIARVVPTTNTARFGWNFSVYSVFQATLIHVYNCTSTDSDMAKMSHEYVKICIEVLAKLTHDIPYGPPIIAFVEKLMSLLGTENKADGSASSNTETGAASSSNNPPPASQSPMSLQKMLAGVEGDSSSGATAAGPVENWSSYSGNAPATAAAATNYLAQQQQEQQQQQQISSPSQQAQQQPQFPQLSQQTWQQLFSSAGTPFTDDNTGFDLQNPWTSYLFNPQGGVDPSFYM